VYVLAVAISSAPHWIGSSEATSPYPSARVLASCARASSFNQIAVELIQGFLFVRCQAVQDSCSTSADACAGSFLLGQVLYNTKGFLSTRCITYVQGLPIDQVPGERHSA
jgi:hypothetical protein